MMSILKLSVVALTLTASTALAAPTNQWNVDANTTSCDVTLDSAAPVNVPASGGKCNFDVGAVAVGPHTTKCVAKLVDPLWGNQTSAASAPYSFTRPGLPAVPTSPTLVP